MTRQELLPIAKPILFNTEMVQAILEGRKTVTRRIVKPQPKGYFEVNDNPLYIYDSDLPPGRIAPQFQAGDYLYVRETWNWYPIENDTKKSYIYRADFSDKQAEHGIWRPSIHMPKEATRIFLKVTDVRVERLTNMLTKDFCNEGLNLYKDDGRTEKSEIELEYEFEDLWNSTIKKADLDTYGWDANPWVWVVEFERVEV